VIVLLALFARIASAQTWVETRVDVTERQAAPRMNSWISGKLAGKVGTFAWLQASKTYAEAYTGLSLAPKPWLQIGAGGGIEQNPSSARFGSFIWMGQGKHSGILIFEAAGSGPWHKAEYKYQITKDVGVGLITERFRGNGIRLESHLPKTPVTLWVAAMKDRGKINGVIGVRIKMD
jgi:hypothetical protein